MKYWKSIFLAALSFKAFAQVQIHEELYIPGHSPEIVKEWLQTGSIIIDHVSSSGFEIYGPKGLQKLLTEKNIFSYDLKTDESLDGYPSSEEIRNKMIRLANMYPKIMKLFSIGKSHQGQDLLVMKISDHVDQDEVEPEFKYISSMHGNEITGRELLIQFMEEIGEKYGRDQELTQLVNNTEIFIMPSMNPDGSDRRQRANAGRVDLNRNFPDILSDRESSSAGRQPETKAVMKFQQERKFSLSANFHGGTIVANYPWDSTYDLHPLDQFVKKLSTEYAELNPAMRSSREFPGGITNGAAWYVVRGGMQDWSYFWHDDLQITVELSHQKWPQYSEIPRYYQDNRDSMVKYMSFIHQGAGIKFKRSNAEGSIKISQLSPKKINLGSFAFSGAEFYKVLPEGDYLFEITEKSGKSHRVDVSVKADNVAENGNYFVIH